MPASIRPLWLEVPLTTAEPLDISAELPRVESVSRQEVLWSI